jgi:hypothetical protein
MTLAIIDAAPGAEAHKHCAMNRRSRAFADPGSAGCGSYCFTAARTGQNIGFEQLARESESSSSEDK